MKITKIFAAVMASLLVLSCAQKEDTAPALQEGKKVTLTFDLDKPQSKVAFDDQENPQLQWTGEETMALVFGKYGEGGATVEAVSTLPSTAKGVFSGAVTIPDGFEITDLQGFVVPAESNPDFRWRSATEARLRMRIPEEQTQTESGEPNWAYSPFFYDLSGTITDATQTEFTFSGLTVKSAADMVKFKVYGKHPDMSDDEVLKSVTVYNSKSNVCTGTAEYTLRSEATNYNNNGSSTAPVVTLTEELTIADKTSDNAIEVFMSIMGKSSKAFSSVTIVTDKATYYKEIESQSLSGKNVTTFNVYQAAINLSNGYTRTEFKPEYSTDGGSTWSSEIPEMFSTLAVSGAIDEDDLTVIKSALDEQSAPVALDLSKTIYSSETFSAVFAGTKESYNTTLKSMVLPSNVVVLPDSAFRYCEALETIDIENITNLGDYAFANSGLKEINISNNVTTLGAYVCANCYDLEEAYFNATDTRLGTPASGGTNFHTFVFDQDMSDTHTVDFKCTIGPDSRTPRYAFRYNANLSVLVFAAEQTNMSASASAGRQGNNSLIDVKYLHTVITKGNNWLYNENYTNIGASLPEGIAKYYVVPDGQTETYAALRMYVGNSGDTGLQSFGFEIIEQSAYDALQ